MSKMLPTTLSIAMVGFLAHVQTANAFLINYTGNTFNTSSGPTKVEATIDFTSPFTPGAFYSLADTASWSISAAGTTVSSSGNNVIVLDDLVLDGSGVIVEWDILIIDVGSPVNFTIGTRNMPFNTNNDGIGEFGTYSFLLANNPGSWSLVNVPEPSSLSLLCLGLCGLGLVARRKRKS